MSDLEDCENNLRDSKFLLDNQDSEQQQRFPEGDRLYMEMMVSATKSKRTGRSSHQEEMENKHFANFQKEYPAHREEIQKCIRCLYEIADKIDKTNKDCTITNIAVSSAGATSGILGILGLTLAPFSAGVSLILSATGIGLGVATTATDISASVAKYIIDSEDLKKVQALMKECQESIRIVMRADEFDFSPEAEVAKFMYKCYKVRDGTKKFQAHVKALKVAQANPELAALVQRATAARSATRVSMEGIEEVETAFRGTTLAMTRGGRMLRAASAGVFFSSMMPTALSKVLYI